jgi:hypothetical protein
LKVLGDLILQPPYVLKRVKYYTAHVSGKLDRDAPARQQVYLNALATVPEIEAYFGNFLYSERWAALVRPPQAKPPTYVWPAILPDLVLVQKAEEKGSDVALASHLVRDAATNKFQAALVLSNDTDLCEPIRIAIQEFGKTVGLLSPIIQGSKWKGKWLAAHPSLVKAASFTLYIHNADLGRAQFPPIIPGTTVTRPAFW